MSIAEWAACGFAALIVLAALILGGWGLWIPIATGLAAGTLVAAAVSAAFRYL